MEDTSQSGPTELVQVSAQEEIDTSSNVVDYTVSGMKGLVGIIPFVGPILAELLGALVPRQRIDRIEAYLRVLNAKVEALDQDRVSRRYQDPAFVQLFEDGAYQAARALSKERIDYIASVVAQGLSAEEVDYLRLKHLLTLLDQINDVQIIMLQSYTLNNDEQSGFYDKHKEVLQVPVLHFGVDDEAFDQNTIHASFKAELIRLGLLHARFKKPKKGELPEFDEKTGTVKVQGYEITSLGRLLLRHIGIYE